MNAKYTSFAVVNGIVKLLRIENKTKRELTDLLSNHFAAAEVDRAIETALNVGLIKKPALMKERYHYQTVYAVVKK